jgi:hypothetical protein
MSISGCGGGSVAFWARYERSTSTCSAVNICTLRRAFPILFPQLRPHERHM